MAKRQVYSFEEKKYSANSIASAILSLLSVLILAGVLLVSFLMKGMANTWIGAVGFTGIVMAFCGLWYGFAGFHDECRSYFCSKFGTIMGTAAIAGWFFIVCLELAGNMYSRVHKSHKEGTAAGGRIPYEPKQR